MLIFIFFVFLAYLAVSLIRRWVVKGQLLDHPNDRSMHLAPTPRGGGLAIVVIVLGTAFASAN